MTTAHSFFISPKPTEKLNPECPLLSLKKFCSSLPCPNGKPSSLNLIKWQRHVYSPNEKERRLRVENDVVKQKITHESSLLNKRHIRTKSLTEPAHEAINYQQQYAKIATNQLTTSLMSREEEEVFGSIKAEDSVREEFKRNHKAAWGFIIRKKKSTDLVQTAPARSHRAIDGEVEARRQEKRRFNQRLHDYLRKWQPVQHSGPAKTSGKQDGPTQCSGFMTLQVKSEAARSGAPGVWGRTRNKTTA